MHVTSKFLRVAFFLMAVLSAPGAIASEAAKLASDDTSVSVEARNDRLILASLKSVQTGREWLAPEGSEIPLISTLSADGKPLDLHWHFTASKVSADSRECTLTFTNNDPPLELHSIWRAFPGPGPVEHSIAIANLGKSLLLLPLQHTLVFDSHAAKPLQVTWVSKGSGTPRADGTHHDKVSAGYAANLSSLPYAENADAIPWVSVDDVEGATGWYAGIEFSGRVLIGLREQAGALHAEMGMDSRNPFHTRLPPGETFEAPVVFVGCHAGTTDDGSNRLRRWVETRLRPAVRDARYPLLVSNSWGSGMAVDAELAHRMIDRAAELGLELYHIDAGWFRAVGDWSADPKKFPGGLAPIADYAHSKGLKFGLWVGWTQGGHVRDEGGKGAVLSVFEPSMKNWFTRDYKPGWKTQEFIGADVCLGDPPAREWCLHTVREVVRANKLDLLEHDQRMIVDTCSRADHLHSEAAADIAYRAARGYYQVYDTLRAENPELLFENCVNGGRMVDYGAVRRCHYISITDTYDPLSNRRAFYDAAYALPPSMCECYIENHPGKNMANFLFMLRSGMMGWCTMMLDMSQWNAEQSAAAKHQFEIYKKTLRPLIAGANLYHVSERPDGVRWDGMEYVDTKTNSGVLFAFRGTTAEQSHTFKLQGLEEGTRYSISSEDGSAGQQIVTGAELMQSGITVKLNDAESSDLLYFRAEK